MNNELYHYGVLGMKWGVRRYQSENGKINSEGKKRYSQKRAYQGQMNAKQREEYAKVRIKSRGARQAIDEEHDAVLKRSMTPFKIGGIGAILGATVGAVVGGPVAAAGAAWISGVGSTALSALGTVQYNIERNTNAERNIDAIRRISDIPDSTVGVRRNTRT